MYQLHAWQLYIVSYIILNYKKKAYSYSTNQFTQHFICMYKNYFLYSFLIPILIVIYYFLLLWKEKWLNPTYFAIYLMGHSMWSGLNLVTVPARLSSIFMKSQKNTHIGLKWTSANSQSQKKYTWATRDSSVKFTMFE